MNPCLIAATAAGLLLASSGWAGDAYERYNRFATESFGAEMEELTYTYAGKEIVFVGDRPWLYVSRNSASVGFETNLPAKAWIEYGPTPDCGSSTPPQERPFYVHLHQLTGLAPGAEYHYRLVAVDESGRRIVSQTREFSTAAMSEAIEIPGTMGEGPYALDKPGAIYLVTEDLDLDANGFVISAAGVTLDLGGRTVVYNSRKMGRIEGDFWKWIKEGGIGVRIWKASGARVLNGTIKQGAGNDAGESNGLGFNPVYMTSAPDCEIAGVTIDYASPQNTGVFCHWGGAGLDLHHNIILDRGTSVINRHAAGSRAFILFDGKVVGVKTHHNLVKRTRQGGLGGCEVFHNEIHMDSWATNSFGIALTTGGKAWGNRVLGGGYHVCAFGWGNRLTGHDNFVHLVAEAFPEKRFGEYGDYASLNGLRLTQYSGSKKPYEDNLYHDNVIVLQNSGGRQVRGVQVFSDPYVKNYLFRDSIVKVTAKDEQSVNGACVVTQGNPKRTPEMLPVVYRNATFISNSCNVKFGDDYGTGSNHRFVNCRFVKTGAHPAYRTFRFGSRFPCKRHVLLDCVFEGGASPDNVEWADKNDDHAFRVAWTLALKSTPGASVTISDKSGTEVFTGSVPADGVLRIPLTEYRQTPAGKEEFTPHTIEVTRNGKTTDRVVAMNRATVMTLQ